MSGRASPHHWPPDTPALAPACQAAATRQSHNRPATLRGWDIKEPDHVERLIRSLPVQGVETFYPPHTRVQTEHLLSLCQELGLTPTASSDFHGPTHKTFSRFGAYNTYELGEPAVPPRR